MGFNSGFKGLIHRFLIVSGDVTVGNVTGKTQYLDIDLVMILTYKNSEDFYYDNSDE
jgi:hypothetical protein